MARLDGSSGSTTKSIHDAVEKKVLQVFELVYADLDGGLYLTNAPYNVTISSNQHGVRAGTYISVGRFLGFSEIKEESKFTISEITATLSGLPAFDDNNDSIIADLLTGDYIDRRAEIARAFFNSNTNEYLDSILIFKGRISAPVIQDDPSETTTVAITASNNWVDYERTNGMVTTDARQQAIYTGDRGMQYSKDVIKDIKWQA